jgi:hypothetical protein
VSKVARLDPAEWVAIDAALAQIKTRVGSAALAARDLRRDLRSGDLVGASRCIGYRPEQESCEIYMRSFWRDVEVREFENHVRIRPLSSDPQHPLFNGQWWFYVRRTELDRRYPHALAEPRAADDKPQRRKPGPKPTDDWPDEVAAELIRIAVTDPKALKNVDKLVTKIQTDFPKTDRFVPQDEKPVRALIVRLLKHIR